MINLGKFNTLPVSRTVDFGVYLDGGEGTGDILLPSRYITSPLHVGDQVEAFIYRDNENRLIATTEHPYAQVGDFAFLQVDDVNQAGAFLDWGLVKQLLVPYSEQKIRLARGMVVPVYVYIDHTTQRIVASAKIEKFLGNVPPRYRRGQRVKALVYSRNEVGYKVIVDNLHAGMIYESDLYGKQLTPGQEMEAWVNRVRPDAKIDLLPHGAGDNRLDSLKDEIKRRLDEAPGGAIDLGDNSSPLQIRESFGCSKRDFKQAIGSLYRERKVVLAPGQVKLAR